MLGRRRSNSSCADGCDSSAATSRTMAIRCGVIFNPAAFTRCNKVRTAMSPSRCLPRWADAVRICMEVLLIKKLSKVQADSPAHPGDATSASRLRQRGVDGARQLAIVGRDLAGERLDQLAVAPDQVLVEVPLGLAAVLRQPGEHGRLPRPLRLHLLEQRKFHMEARVAERGNLRGGTRLLPPEVVRGKAQHHEPLPLARLVQAVTYTHQTQPTKSSV